MGTKKVIGLVAAALIAGLVLGSFGIAQAGSTAAKKQVAAQAASATVACPNAANGTLHQGSRRYVPHRRTVCQRRCLRHRRGMRERRSVWQRRVPERDRCRSRRGSVPAALRRVPAVERARRAPLSNFTSK